MAYDAAHSQTVVFGGENAAGSLFNDTWLWDGVNWTQKFSQTTPPAREAFAMAYDAARGQVVLFGGNTVIQKTLASYLNDTWVWDGSNWTQKFPQNSPPGRFGHAMAYDAAHGQIVLFGGTNTSLLSDTWLWDGTNWTQASPQTSPSGRSLHAMACDSARKQIVLFGGNSNGTLLNDTWTWDGASWSKKSPQTSPPAREGPAMAYDSAHGETVLFGGGVFTFNGLTVIFSDLADTWTWDGTNWTQQPAQAGPAARDSGGMIFDPAHDRIVLFGGATGAAPNTVVASDTWAWSGGPLPAPVIAGVQSAADFGASAIVAPGSWVEIYGANLADSTRTWNAADFQGNMAPFSLDGVSVTVGGQTAFVDYVSPGQVNAQLPSGLAIGSLLPLAVTNADGTSAAFAVAVNAAEPGLLAPASFQIGGLQYVVALHPDGVTYVLPQTPAQAGETITMYGIGFGPVTPQVAAGQIATGQNQLSLPLQIAFAGTAAALPYAGLAPGQVGLYQFNVVVPAVAAADAVPLTFRLADTAGTQMLFTAVR